ncbi:hypothetical protein [Halostagnicola kamekurae]|uniref:Uncharacterized protein n=1 Tax=Halostagnicola kamekurae TaxID=619731 RepID=A0A1I6QW66_9EURY|nr:hypothetical protein [Halostagnicola kamekurae]SFS56488.1 hypothetical protein SAMN04488556_1612 [Halostagnicola kamekurae]
MDAPVPEQDTDTERVEAESATVISSHEPRPGKLVVTERNNTDGWIASDTAVDLEP